MAAVMVITIAIVIAVVIIIIAISKIIEFGFIIEPNTVIKTRSFPIIGAIIAVVVVGPIIIVIDLDSGPHHGMKRGRGRQHSEHPCNRHQKFEIKKRPKYTARRKVW